jgi:4-hydroxy-3-methylbut-2-enyl diphosphate reductase
MTLPPLRVVLAQPRGFCAGVERAIEIVERALERFGPPVYVRHEIVHNKHVVQALQRKGACFVDGRRSPVARDRRGLPAGHEGA